LYSGYELWRLRLFSFCGYGLALAALALVLFGAYDSYPLCIRYNRDFVFAATSSCQFARFVKNVRMPLRC